MRASLSSRSASQSLFRCRTTDVLPGLSYSRSVSKHLYKRLYQREDATSRWIALLAMHLNITPYLLQRALPLLSSIGPKIINPSIRKGGVVWENSFCRKVSHLLFEQSPIILSTEAALSNDLSHSRVPLSYLKPSSCCRQSLSPARMSKALMYILENQIRDVLIFSYRIIGCLASSASHFYEVFLRLSKVHPLKQHPTCRWNSDSSRWYL